MRRETWCLFSLALLVLPAAAAANPVLSYSTYLRGSGGDLPQAITTDSSGNVYIAGSTTSPDFPVHRSSIPFVGPEETFVTKLAPDGSLVYSTFLGVAGNVVPESLAVDSAGRVHVAGSLTTPDASDAFVARLSPAGDRLEYLKVLAGEGGDRAGGIAVDPAGNAYVAGLSNSPLFPLEQPIGVLSEGTAAFVIKLDPAGDLVYATYLGGSEDGARTAIAVDTAGHAYVTGTTDSPDYPAVFDSSPFWSGSYLDIFVVKLHPSGGWPVYTTLLEGRSSADSGVGIAIDAAGQAYVVAEAHSGDLPTLHAFQTSLGGPVDAYVAKLDAAGALVYATYLGGTWIDLPGGIAVDGAGSAHVAGITFSYDFPTRDPIQASCRDTPFCRDVLVAKLSPDGSALAFSTYLGGSAADLGAGIALAPGKHLWITGWTSSTDFPTVSPLQPAGGDFFEGFVSKISLATNALPDCSAATANPSLLWPPDRRLRTVAVRGVTDPDGEPVTLAVTRITQDELLSKLGQPDATGIGTARPMVRADRMDTGDGRVYHLTFTARDPSGAACTGRVTVCVPLRSDNPTCRDGGPRFNSTGF